MKIQYLARCKQLQKISTGSHYCCSTQQQQDSHKTLESGLTRKFNNRGSNTSCEGSRWWSQMQGPKAKGMVRAGHVGEPVQTPFHRGNNFVGSSLHCISRRASCWMLFFETIRNAAALDWGCSRKSNAGHSGKWAKHCSPLVAQTLDFNLNFWQIWQGVLAARGRSCNFSRF